MEKWIARENNGDLFLCDNEPREVLVDLDTSPGRTNPHYGFAHWNYNGGRIILHTNTLKSVGIGQKRKCQVEIKLL